MSFHNTWSIIQLYKVFNLSGQFYHHFTDHSA